MPLHDQVPSSTVQVYQSELDFVSRCILDYPNIETGGQLFGYWTAEGTPVVLFAIGPGPRANHQVTFFNQDVDYLVRVGGILIHRYGLRHIGEWHSHHQLGLARPSGHDAQTMVDSIAKEGLGRFLLCIGNCGGRTSTFNAFNFHERTGYEYKQAGWEVKPMVSPFRAAIETDPELGRMLTVPRTPRPHMAPLAVASGDARLATPVYGGDYWLNDKANNRVLKQIVDYLAAVAPSEGVNVQLDAEKCVHVNVRRGYGVEHVYFPKAFPYEAPVVELPPDAPRSPDPLSASAGGNAEHARLPRSEVRRLHRLADRKGKRKWSRRVRLLHRARRCAAVAAGADQPHLPAAGVPPAPPKWVFTGEIYPAFTAFYKNLTKRGSNP